jgi:hypothetical protein
MKNHNFKLYLLSTLLVGLFSCNSNEDSITKSASEASQLIMMDIHSARAQQLQQRENMLQTPEEAL